MPDMTRGMPPETFDDATRQNIVPLTQQAYASGGVVSFALPTSGLGARLYLHFQGTLTNGGVPATTVTGPWSLIARVTIRVNSGITIIDASGYGLAMMAKISGQFLGDETNFDTEPGSTATGRNNLFQYPTANNGILTFVLPVPLAWNVRDDIALLLLQNQRAQVTCQVTFNTTTGADLRFPYTGGTTVALTGTLSPFLEFFTLPNDPALMPDLLIAKQVVEFNQSITATGDQQVSLNRGNTYTKIMHWAYINTVLDPSNITKLILRYDQNVRPYEYNQAIAAHLHMQRYNRFLPDGFFIWDLAWQGLAGLGYFRDTIDSEAVSELTSIVTVGTGATIAGVTTLQTVTEQLLHLEPTA